MKRFRYIFTFPFIGLLLSTIIFFELTFGSFLGRSSAVLSGIGFFIFLIVHIPITLILWGVIGFLLDRLKFCNDRKAHKISKIITFLYFFYIIFILLSQDWGYSNRDILILLSLPSSVIMFFDTIFEYGFYRSFALYILPLNLIFVYYISYIVTKKKFNVYNEANSTKESNIVNDNLTNKGRLDKKILFVLLVILLMFIFFISM